MFTKWALVDELIISIALMTGDTSDSLRQRRRIVDGLAEARAGRRMRLLDILPDQGLDAAPINTTMFSAGSSKTPSVAVVSSTT